MSQCINTVEARGLQNTWVYLGALEQLDLFVVLSADLLWHFRAPEASVDLVIVKLMR